MNKESPTFNAQISPRASLVILSREEITRLRDLTQGGMHELLRRCALAVLTTGTESDDPRASQVRYPDFDIEVLQFDRGIKLELSNAPASAFVDGRILHGVADLLFVSAPDDNMSTAHFRALVVRAGDRLLDEGVFAQPVVFPTVAIDKARLRTIVTAAHSDEQLDIALAAFDRVGHELGLITG